MFFIFAGGPCLHVEAKYFHHYDSPSRQCTLYQLVQEVVRRMKDRMGWLYALLRKKPAHKGSGPQTPVAKDRGVCPVRHFINRTNARLWPTGFV